MEAAILIGIVVAFVIYKVFKASSGQAAVGRIKPQMDKIREENIKKSQELAKDLKQKAQDIDDQKDAG